MSNEPETNYTTLFGPMDHAEGNEARSVLSPAAYLVDLLQLRDSLVDSKTEDPAGYHERRPDVGQIKLDQANTFTEIPYLDIANTVMGDLATNDALTSNLFPPPLPFSEQHLRLAVYAQKLGTRLDEIQRVYRTSVDPRTSARLSLGLSQEEYNLFSTAHGSDQDIKKLWGVDDAPPPDPDRGLKLLRGDVEPPLGESSQVERIKQKLGLSLKELKQLVRQDLSEDELKAETNNAAASFFINQGPYIVLDEHAGKLRLRDGTPLGGALANHHLDRMMRFVRLARRLDVELVDLDWLIQTACGNVLDDNGLQSIALALALRKTSEWPIDEICSLWSVPKSHGHGDSPVPADLFDRAYNNDFPVTLEALVRSLPDATVDALDDRLQATLRLSGADFAFLQKAIRNRVAAPPPHQLPFEPRPPLAYSDVAFYFSGFLRIVALSKLLSLDVEEVVMLLDVLGAQWAVSAHEDLAIAMPFSVRALPATPLQLLLQPRTRPEPPAPPDPPPLPPWPDPRLQGALDVLQKLIRVKEWLDQRQLSVRQLAYICLEDHLEARQRLNEAGDAPIDDVQPDDAVEAALDDLYQALRDSMLAPSALQTGSLSANGALAVFDSLRDARVLVTIDAPDRALLRVQPSTQELAEAMQLGIHERLELHASDFAALGITEMDLLFSLLVSHGYAERLDETAGEVPEAHYFIAPGLTSYFSAPDSATRFTIPNFQEHAEAVFSALAQRVDAARVEAAALIAAGIDSLDVPALFEVLEARGYVEPVFSITLEAEYCVAANAKDFLRDPANAAQLVLPNFAAGFAVLAAKVDAFQRALDNFDAEAKELGDRLSAFSEQQTRASIRSLSGLLGLAEDLTELAFGWAFGTPDEEMTQTLATLTLPLFQAKHQEPPEPALADAYVASRFRRLQQLALLLRKTAMTAEEARVYLANQHIHQRLPETLKLPEGFLPASGRIDALTTLPNGDFLIINNLTGQPPGPKYVAFSRHDYHLLGKMDTLDKIPGVQLPNDPPDTFCKRVLDSGIDAAFSDTTVDGKPVLHLCAGDRYVTVSETGTSAAKPITDWGKVRNNIQDTARVDAAVQTKDGRLFLFSRDQYFVYSDPQQLLTKQTFVNERYPRSIRGKFEQEEGVPPLPALMFSGVDAAFRDGDTYYFFSGNRFTRSTDPYNLVKIRPTWGHVLNDLFEENRVDTAFVLGGATYLTRKNQLTRYSGAYQIVDETFPISFDKAAESEPLLRVLGCFPDGLDAALAGSDGRLYAFKDDNYASSDAPKTSLTISDRWGRVRNVFVDNQRVDAALALNGLVYLFCGDQYVRYSGSDYTYVDEGHLLRVRPNWNAREQIGLVPDGLPLPITAVAVGRTPGGTSDDVYFFGGHQYAGPKGALGDIQAHWARVRNNIERTGVVDAAMLDGAGRMYLFSSDQLYRYSAPEQAYCDESYPQRLAVAWAQVGDKYSLPDAFAGGISAALRTDEGSVFLFSGQGYARADVAQTEPPRANSQDWGLVRNEIQSKNAVSAAYVDPAGKTYVFGGDQFVRYSGTAYDVVDEGFPLAIATRWPSLPVDFRSDIDAALSFKSPVDGVQRLYLFKGDRYARFSSGDFTQLDAGYPKQNLDAIKAEGLWFRGLAVHEPNPGSSHQDDPIVSVEAAYADTAGGQPGIVVFYRHEGGVQWRREYRNGSWQAPKRMDDLTDYQPFTRLDAAFVSADGTLHAFSGNQYASRPPGGSALTAPVPIQSRWGRVWNQFADLGRVDACLNMGDGRIYLFCARQYIKYTGPLRPGASDFFVVEGYPRRIDPSWAGEGVPVALAPEFQAAGYDLCRDAAGKIHLFNGTRTTFSGNPGPDVLLTSRWGKVENRFQDLDRVDGAYRAENGKLYLFCDTQYTRYSGPVQPGAPDFWGDEGYPLRIATGWPSEGLATAMPAQWDALGYAVFRDAEQTYVFQGSLVSTPAPVISTWSTWANVRNLIQSDNRVDAGFVLARGAGSVTLLFRGDQYVRYSGGYDDPVDEGYPKVIAHLEASDGVFPGLPALLQSGLRAIFAGTDGNLHAFGPQPPDASQPQLYVSSAKPDVLRPLNEQWGIVDNKLWDNEFVDAALLAPNGKLYLFSGDQYVLYSGSDRSRVDEGYPQKIASSYAKEIGAAALAPIVNQGVDAALTIGNTTFYFVQDKYVSTEQPAVAQPLVDRWGLVDNRLQAGRRLDAAFVAPNGKLYLFAEGQYSVYSGADRRYVDEEHPQTIAADLGLLWPHVDGDVDFRSGLDTAAVFEGRSYLFKDAKHVRISDYRLTKADAGYPLDTGSKLVDRFDFELGALPDGWRIKQLFDDYASQTTTLLDYLDYVDTLDDLDDSTKADMLSQLARATQWPENEIGAVLKIYGLGSEALLDGRVVARLARCFELADRMGTTPSKFTSDVWSQVFDSSTPPLEAAADFLYGLIKAATGPKDWPGVARSLQDLLQSAKRDALVAYLVKKLEKHDANDLYEHLLTDVQMDASSSTSKLVEAINSIQLYYHRLLIQLEAGPEPQSEVGPADPNYEKYLAYKAFLEFRANLKAWWPWMKNYRIWEANRKVFLHPENYIRPELRPVKSPAFEELEDKLLQDEITKTTVQDGYRQYLESFNEIAQLRIVGGYRYTYMDDSGHPLLAVVMFGATRTDPPVYYYRMGDVTSDDIDWEPWQKVGITIDSDRVQPVYAFNRLFIFWIETRPFNSTSFSSDPKDSYSADSPSAKQVQLTVKFSFYNFSKEWVAPQALRLNPDDPADPEVLPPHLQEIQIGTMSFITFVSSALPAATGKGVRLIAYTRVPDLHTKEDSIYLSLHGAPGDWALGQLTAGLDLVPSNVMIWGWQNGDALADPAMYFPSQIGIHPRELSAIVPWGARVEDSNPDKSDWFSFDAKGGTFLCRPDPTSTVPPTILDYFKENHPNPGDKPKPISAVFRTDTGHVFVFSSAEKNGVNRLCFYHYVPPHPDAPAHNSDQDWQGPVFMGDPAWPWGRPQGVFQKYPEKRIKNVIVGLDGITYFLLDSEHFRYPRGRYDATIERYITELKRGSPTLAQLVGRRVPSLSWESSTAQDRSLVRAFKLPGEERAVVVTRAGEARGMVTLGLDELRQVSARAGHGCFEGWDQLDTVFQVNDPEPRVIFSHGAQLVILTWSSQSWSTATLDDAAGLSAAFSSNDGTLYFFRDDQYAEVDPKQLEKAQSFGPVTTRWGRPSLFSWLLSSVDGALWGPDGKLYLFCKERCLSYTGFDPGALDTQVPDPRVPDSPVTDPRKVTQVWPSPFGQQHGVELVTAAIEGNGRTYLFGKQKNGASFMAGYSQASQSPFYPDTGYPVQLPQLPTLSVDFYARLLATEQKYWITRLTSHTSEQLGRRLFAHGIPGLLSLDTQRLDELPSFTPLPTPLPDPLPQAGPDELFVDTGFVSKYPGMPSDGRSAPKELDFASANGFYYREIFFHIPYLIAQALRQGQKFEDARSWYEYVFDPTSPVDKQYWQYVEFLDAPPGPNELLADQVHAYHEDPFDPHKIAELRPIAYRKAFVMSYIGNLLDWGDMMFRQYTRESLGEATMLYVLAADLLGKKPEELGKREMATPESKPYNEIKKPDYANIALTDEILMLENGVPTPDPTLPKTIQTIQTPNDSIFNPYFYIPENAEFVKYWHQVDDRLSKIRNGLDIDGVKRALALFAPPVDVMALVKAFASGAGLAETLANYDMPVPHHRSSVMLAHARELTGRLIGLGGALLAALEKKEAEELSQLRNTQERSILEMQLEIKNQQLAGARESLAALQEGLKNAKAREKHYQDLLAKGLSAYEQTQIAGMIVSQVFSQVANVFSTASSIGYAVPQLGSPMAITYGGIQLGSIINGLAGGFRSLAEWASFGSSLAATLGGFERRAQDWELQSTLATGDTLQIGRQIKAAEIQVEVARQDVQVQRRLIKNNQSIDTFMNSKFTSQQLYQWMAGKLSAVYFQTYHLAHQYAKAAQRAMQFELGLPESDVQYIGAGYWDSLKKGLTAGEQLQLDLDRLEKAQLEANERRMEITKYVSLAQVDPLALLHLKERGTCEFELGEALFAADFPGHYCRQIKTVSLSFPALIGPYHNFNATLTQLGHRTLMAPDKGGLNYLLGKTTTEPDAALLRIDWRPNQQIALSTGTNDSGLFEVNYHDERYLPFEGTGAVSTWRLEINGVDGPVHRQTLSDVILTVRYTARTGGSAFAETVKNAIGKSSTGRAWLLNLATDFSDQWQAFMSKPSEGMAFTVECRNLPGASEKEVTGVYLHYELVEDPVDDLSRQAITLTSGLGERKSEYTLKPGAFTKVELPLNATWKLMPASPSAAAKLSPRNLKTIALVVTYASKPSF